MNNTSFHLIRRSKWIAIAIMSFMFSPMVTATLIGDVIEVNGWSCTVGHDCEGASGGGFDQLSVGASSIFIDVSEADNLGGWVLEFRSLDWVGMPDGILVDVELSFTGIFHSTGNPVISNITDHGFDLSYFHLVENQNETITMNLITNHDVPEPTTLTLLSLGLLGLRFNRRKISN